MDDPTRLDATAVKVLAHPVRSRLLSSLRRGGAATATQLAALLDTNTGVTSYHLRKLESVGLVVDTGDGEGKRRLWRAAGRSHAWNPSDFAGDQEATAALGWLTRHYLSQLVECSQRWLDVEETWPARWRDACGLDDDSVLVTAEQLAALREEVEAVLARYREAGAGDPGALRVAVYATAYPRDLGERADR